MKKKNAGKMGESGGKTEGVENLRVSAFPLPTWLKDARPASSRGRRPAAARTIKPGTYKAGAAGAYVFRFADLQANRPAGPKVATGYYADTALVTIEGKQLFIGLAHEKAGMGSRPHRHANDQFNLVLKGTLRCRVGKGPEMLVPAGCVVYFPANVMHSSGATADEDVIFYVCKDRAFGIAGVPVDKRGSGPKKGFAAVTRR